VTKAAMAKTGIFNLLIKCRAVTGESQPKILRHRQSEAHSLHKKRLRVMFSWFFPAKLVDVK